MNLIKLSTILYPSLPGSTFRQTPGSRVNGELVLNTSIRPKYFSEGAKNRVIVLAKVLLGAGLIILGYFILKDFGVF